MESEIARIPPPSCLVSTEHISTLVDLESIVPSLLRKTVGWNYNKTGYKDLKSEKKLKTKIEMTVLDLRLTDKSGRLDKK